MNDILDGYFKSAPSAQNMLDLFKGEWSSKLPSLHGQDLLSGSAELFDDQRIRLLNEYFSLEGKTVLELGPLEAGHTYMVHQIGAKAILGVESNSRSFLKCLIVKELYGLKNTQFLLGDAMEYMKTSDGGFDVCMASGILYHSTNPFEFIEHCAKMSNKVFVWTHYYNADTMKNYPNLNGRFESETKQNWNGEDWPSYQFKYKESLDWKGFCGGPLPYSLWITREDIFKAFNQVGLTKIHVFFDSAEHPNGPNICFMAEK